MKEHYLKATISEDGKSFEFYVGPEQWWAKPGVMGEWTVVGPEGVPGFGLSIWAAVEDAKKRSGRWDGAIV